MKRLALTNFGLRFPWVVLVIALVTTGLFASRFPSVNFDNDPENMLADDEPVRVFHHRVKEKYALYDFVIVGIVNETHADGVWNVETLTRIDDLTQELISLHRSESGQPVVTRPARGHRPEETIVPSLGPTSVWARLLNLAFRQDPTRLFDADGQSVIIGREIIAPGVVDSLKQAELGQLKIEYLMEEVPRDAAEARQLRDDALGNPLYRGTLASADGQAIALYIPIIDKTYSYNVANLVEALTAGWGSDDRVYITGLPVAEDTFGVEMLVQMASSAPLAGLAIFILLYLFFRRLSLIIAPMIVAVLSVVCTMGLLIGLGFDVHIMSSMIAIFLMPIAVADSVHILSEFFDSYHRYRDRAETMRQVIRHLFMPMLYTSLTTIAGFASLALTPIPPVRVFGLHVAFGVGLAWLLSMILVPAYVMVAVSERSLEKLASSVPVAKPARKRSRLQSFLEWLGGFAYRRWKPILAAVMVLVAISVAGILQIIVNDNPVNWFTASHRIRVADRVLNGHFGGTYTAYLTLTPRRVETFNCAEKAAMIRSEAERRFAPRLPEATARFLDKLAEHGQAYENVSSSDLKKCFVAITEEAGRIDAASTQSWRLIADAVNYLDPGAVTLQTLLETVNKQTVIDPRDREVFVDRVQALPPLTGAELQTAALEITDDYTGLSFREFMYEMEAELTAPLLKQPPVLAYLESLQSYLAALPVVGKTSSAVDALKKANYELNYLAPVPGTSVAAQEADRKRNESYYAIPPSASATAQVFTQLEGTKKKDSLFHLVTKDYQEANVWVQLKSGDNQDMESVVAAVTKFVETHPPPGQLRLEWAGLTYLNVVWQDKMVVGMLNALAGSFVVVLVMMMILFRSPLTGLLSMIPLSVTILFIYGLIGLIGKDYDMPVAVLSALTLGLSVDFAIHFLQRARELTRQTGSWQLAARQMFGEPAMAISRNAIIISVGFTPLLVAPLVPYRTVGLFIATIMAVSWLATLFILAALATALERWLYRTEPTEEARSLEGKETDHDTHSA